MEEERVGSFFERIVNQRRMESVPLFLFKFVSAESNYFQLAMHELFLHSRIFLSARRDFNDPFDTILSLKFETPQQVGAFVRGIFDRNSNLELAPEFAASIDDPETFSRISNTNLATVLDGAGIYSLTDSVQHPLMWAHYGCSHRGIALIFDHESLPSALPVEYADERTTAPIEEGVDVSQLLTKGIAWQYEREWRIVLPRRARTWFDLSAATFRGLIFGARRPEEDETAAFLAELIRRRSDAGLPPLAIMKAQAEGFGLRFFQLQESEWVATFPP